MQFLAGIIVKTQNVMIYSLESKSFINKIPHQTDFRDWRNRISGTAYEAIIDHLDSLVDGTEVMTSSWIPGADWSGTPFEPIYHACRQNEDAAAQFFGLILWDVMLRRDDCWAFGRYDKEGIPIRGLTYFKIQCP